VHGGGGGGGGGGGHADRDDDDDGGDDNDGDDDDDYDYNDDDDDDDDDHKQQNYFLGWQSSTLTTRSRVFVNVDPNGRFNVRKICQDVQTFGCDCRWQLATSKMQGQDVSIRPLFIL